MTLPPPCYRCNSQPCVCKDGVTLYCGDCRDVLAALEPGSVDLVFGSPPYEDARTYGMDCRLTGEAWVEWMVDVVRASLRVCRGLVAFVVDGRTRRFRWSATPVLLMADLHRAGVHLRKPPAFHRVGIPGSGGPDWLRNDYEFIVCATNGGKLPWSDNTAMGHPPKWAPGGEMSHRLTDGARVNQWGHSIDSVSCAARRKNGVRQKGSRPSHVIATKKQLDKLSRPGGHIIQTILRDGQHSQASTVYAPPVLANPGNVIRCNVGGGQMGDNLAHQNEAPFPESLSELFVRSFCPEGGIVLDPFSGSGTTVAVAKKHGRVA